MVLCRTLLSDRSRVSHPSFAQPQLRPHAIGKTGLARRLSWDEPSLTLTCAPAQKQTERCHPEETRPLTIREYARIQTFPDEWHFCGSLSSIYKQIGNAVPVNLALAMGRSLVKVLNEIEECDFKTEKPKLIKNGQIDLRL